VEIQVGEVGKGGGAGRPTPGRIINEIELTDAAPAPLVI